MIPAVNNPVPLTASQAAKAGPISGFAEPKDIVSAVNLTTQEKSHELTQWESDAKALQRATDEGMSGGNPPRLDEVKSAQTMLTRLKARMQAVNGDQKTTGVDSIVLSVDQARQGVTGHNVRYVLGYGLAGTVVAFVLIALYLSNR